MMSVTRSNCQVCSSLDHCSQNPVIFVHQTLAEHARYNENFQKATETGKRV